MMSTGFKFIILPIFLVISYPSISKHETHSHPRGIAESLRQVYLSLDESVEWLKHHTIVTPSGDQGPYPIYGKYLFRNAQDHGLIPEKSFDKNSPQVPEEIIIRNFLLGLLSIFEKPSEQLSETEKKIIARNNDDFRTLFVEYLSKTGQQRYAQEPEQLAREAARCALIIGLLY